MIRSPNKAIWLTLYAKKNFLHKSGYSKSKDCMSLFYQQAIRRPKRFANWTRNWLSCRIFIKSRRKVSESKWTSQTWNIIIWRRVIKRRRMISRDRWKSWWMRAIGSDRWLGNFRNKRKTINLLFPAFHPKFWLYTTKKLQFHNKSKSRGQNWPSKGNASRPKNKTCLKSSRSLAWNYNKSPKLFYYGKNVLHSSNPSFKFSNIKV